MSIPFLTLIEDQIRFDGESLVGESGAVGPDRVVFRHGQKSESVVFLTEILEIALMGL